MKRSCSAGIALIAVVWSVPAFAEQPHGAGAVTPGDAVLDPKSAEALGTLRAETKRKDEQIAAAKTEAQEAKLDMEALKSGKLVQLGLTGGVAAALQIGTGAQKTPELTTMPYVLAIPGYWRLPQATRAYCASHWGSGDESSSTDAARAIAQKSAKQMYDAAVAALQAQRLQESKRTGPVDRLTAAADRYARIAIAKKYLHVESGVSDDTLYIRIKLVEESIDQESYRERAIANIANAIWNPALRGRCGWTKVGFWVGLPLAYNATTSLREVDAAKPTEMEREITPKFAAGAAFVPNAYFALLVGATVSTLAQRDIPAAGGEPAKMGVDKTVASVTVAVGGNLDLLGILTK